MLNGAEEFAPPAGSAGNALATDALATDVLVTDGLPPVLGGFDLTDLDRFGGGFPHDVFTRLRQEAPILHHPAGTSKDGEGFWVLSSYADCAAAGSDIALFSSEKGGDRIAGGTHIDDLPTGLFTSTLINMSDDPLHQALKDVMSPAVSADALSTLGPRMREQAAAIVTEAAGRGSFDFQRDVAAKFAVTTIALLLGVPEADWPKFLGWTDIAMGYEDRNTGVATNRSQLAQLGMFNYAVKLLRARKAEPTGDLASLIASGEFPPDTGVELTDAVRRANFNLLSLAGTEPPRGALSIGMLTLLEHPDQWQLLRDDPSLLTGAVEEMLRWSSPTPYNRRTVTRDTEISGVPMRAGEKVTLWWASANRDEAVFADPFDFDIRRDPNPHLAFGMGGHSCLGEQLGRLEMALLFQALLDQEVSLESAGQVTWARHNKHTVILEMPVKLTA
jgi:cytochrome P450